MSDTAEVLAPGALLFAALRAIEERCRKHAAGLPIQEERPTVWAGVLFLVGETYLLTPLPDIAEVLDLPPEITRVPSTKTWVRGVANNRGTLLPIFDLQAFLFDVPTAQSPKNRVLVVRQDELAFGLLVTDVVGIRHFETAERQAILPSLAAALQPYVVGCYGDEQYAVFHVEKLGKDPGFGKVAA